MSVSYTGGISCAFATFVLIDVIRVGFLNMPFSNTGVPDEVHNATTSASRTQSSRWR